MLILLSWRRWSPEKKDAGLLGRPAPGSVENDWGGESRSARVGGPPGLEGGIKSRRKFWELGYEAAGGVEHVSEQDGTSEGSRNSGEQAEEFRRAEGFGEEGHVQLHFLVGVSIGPWVVWLAGFFVVPSMSCYLQAA